MVYRKTQHRATSLLMKAMVECVSYTLIDFLVHLTESDLFIHHKNIIICTLKARSQMVLPFTDYNAINRTTNRGAG